MNKMKEIGLIVLASIYLTACASLPMSEPKRAPYTGTDNVANIDAGAFVGSWNANILNPIEGEKNGQKITYLYKADGTVTVTMDNTNTGNPMTDMVLEMIGSWQVDGELITQKADSIRETSGNKLAGIMTGLMNGMKKRMVGSANVYVLERNRIVLVGEEDQHQAMELIRIQ